MPIRPEHRWLYPIDCRELSREIQFKRAGGRCEHCRRPQGTTVCHLSDGRWRDEEDKCWRSGRGRALRLSRVPEQETSRTRVVLACRVVEHVTALAKRGQVALADPVPAEGLRGAVR